MIITIDDFKLYNNLSDDTSEDDLIQQQLGYAQKLIENSLGYNLDASDYEFSLDGIGEYFVSIPVKPINTITSLTINSVVQNLDDYLIRNNHIIRRDRSFVFTDGLENIEVELNAGYTLFPDDIKGVALEIASLLWSEKGQNIGVTSRTIDEYGTRVFVKNTRFDDYLNRLRPYRIFI